MIRPALAFPIRRLLPVGSPVRRGVHSASAGVGAEQERSEAPVRDCSSRGGHLAKQAGDAVDRSSGISADRDGEGLGKLLKEALCLLQVGRIEALGEPAVDLGEALPCFLHLTLLPPEATEVQGGA